MMKIEPTNRHNIHAVAIYRQRYQNRPISNANALNISSSWSMLRRTLEEYLAVLMSLGYMKGDMGPARAVDMQNCR